MQANGDGSKFATDKRTQGMKARHRKAQHTRSRRHGIPGAKLRPKSTGGTRTRVLQALAVAVANLRPSAHVLR